jgi:hypothetical protein
MNSSAWHSHVGHLFSPLTLPRKSALWMGRVLSAIPILMMGFSATMKLIHAPQMASVWVNKFGWLESSMTAIALVELGCAILFMIPNTAVLGAILMASFFGGAFSTHLRIGDGAGGVVPILLAVLAWLGLYLRDERLRALVPLRGLWRETTRIAAP